ncbi:MAG: hypothetical protein IKK81_07270 [Prevotella sp.]|nr:hypothetical protein [Prevotella sp.]
MTCTVHPLRCASVPPTCCAPFRLPAAWTALWRYVMVRGGESMIASGTHRQRAHGNTVTSLPGTPSRRRSALCLQGGALRWATEAPCCHA